MNLFDPNEFNHNSRLRATDGQERCLVCNSPIDPEWLKSEDDPRICNKKSCWEKFLPMDLAKKYLTVRDRYQILKDTIKQNEIRP